MLTSYMTKKSNMTYIANWTEQVTEVSKDSH